MPASSYSAPSPLQRQAPLHALAWLAWVVASVVALSLTRNPLYLLLVLFCLGLVLGEARQLRQEMEVLRTEVARMENLTRRLSDDYLDLDLLDQQARDVLGLIRSDEIVIR